MSNFKLEFTLKQHTPMIHFQSDQTGATLRATELKPKLDRFLIKELSLTEIIEKKEVPKEEYKSWFIGEGKNHLALKYKVKIQVPSDSDKSLPNKSLYFANNPIKDDKKKVKMVINNTLKIEFISFKAEIITTIKKYFDAFMLRTNFGTRQSKGFGSFLRLDITNLEIEKIFKNLKNRPFLLGRYTNYNQAFKTIDIFYKKIKMGINRPYSKSLLFEYMCDTYNIGWEKKFIKNKFPSVIHGTHKPIVCKEPDDQVFKYIRAVLGLAEHNEFRPRDGKKQIKIKNKSGIERFKSPLTFKIFNGKIYILYDESYKKILDKKFTFSLYGTGYDIYTPKEFDMYDFLKFLEKRALISEVKK